MSNHFSAAYLKFPGDDARLDLTDLFVFGAPAGQGTGDPGKTVLIMDVNPFMMGLNALRPARPGRAGNKRVTSRLPAST